MKISIVTINYNNIAGLRKTTESVLNQSYEEIEFIIIDGGSNDGSEEFIFANDKLFSYSISEPDKGVYDAMNKGLRKVTGEYCLFLNSGDYLYDNEVLENVVKEIDFNSDFVYGLIQWENTNELWNPKRDLVDYQMVFSSLIPHQASFFRSSVIKNLGGYKDYFVVVSDWALMLEMIHRNYKTQKLDRIISICENQGISAKHEKLAKKERFDFLKKYSKLLLLKGCMYRLKNQLFKK